MPDAGSNTLSDAAIGDLRRIRSIVLGNSGGNDDGVYSKARLSPSEVYKAKLATSMTAASLDSPNTTTVNVWLPDMSSGSSPRPYLVATDSIILGMTVTNTWNINADVGLQVRIAFEFGEWHIVGVDCP